MTATVAVAVSMVTVPHAEVVQPFELFVTVTQYVPGADAVRYEVVAEPWFHRYVTPLDPDADIVTIG